jgi:hypothetical protein
LELFQGTEVSCGLARHVGRRRCSGRPEEEGGGVNLGGPCGLHMPVGRLVQIQRKEFLQNLNWILDFAKALKICTRRFRRNFGVEIFPKLP